MRRRAADAGRAAGRGAVAAVGPDPGGAAALRPARLAALASGRPAPARRRLVRSPRPRAASTDRAVVVGADRDELRRPGRAGRRRTGRRAVTEASRRARQGRVRVLRPGLAAGRHGPRSCTRRSRCSPRRSTRSARELDRHLDRPLRDVVGDDGEPLDQTRVHAAGAVRRRGRAVPARWSPGASRAGRRSAATRSARSPPRTSRACCRLDDACALVAARGRLMQALPGGRRDGRDRRPTEDEVAPLLSRRRRDRGGQRARVGGRLRRARPWSRRSPRQFATRAARPSGCTVSHAFHSPLMEPMLEEFRGVAEALSSPSRRSRSSRTSPARREPGELRTPDYWVRHVREAVRFADGVAALAADGVTRSSSSARTACSSRHGRRAGPRRRTSARPGAAQRRAEARPLVGALAPAARPRRRRSTGPRSSGRRRTRVDLPTYAFQRELLLAAGGTGTGDRRRGPERTGRSCCPRRCRSPATAGSCSPTGFGQDAPVAGRAPRLRPDPVPGHGVPGGSPVIAGDQVGAPGVEEFVLEAPLVLDDEAQLQVAVGGRDQTGARAVRVLSRRDDAHRVPGGAPSWLETRGGGGRRYGRRVRPAAWAAGRRGARRRRGPVGELRLRRGVEYGRRSRA